MFEKKFDLRQPVIGAGLGIAGGLVWVMGFLTGANSEADSNARVDGIRKQSDAVVAQYRDQRKAEMAKASYDALAGTLLELQTFKSGATQQREAKESQVFFTAVQKRMELEGFYWSRLDLESGVSQSFYKVALFMKSIPTRGTRAEDIERVMVSCQSLMSALKELSLSAHPDSSSQP